MLIWSVFPSPQTPSSRRFMYSPANSSDNIQDMQVQTSRLLMLLQLSDIGDFLLHAAAVLDFLFVRIDLT